MTAMAAMMRPGAMKAQPQPSLRKYEATTEPCTERRGLALAESRYWIGGCWEWPLSPFKARLAQFATEISSCILVSS